jgi:hypothetical protein
MSTNNEEPRVEMKPDQRKPYVKPEILHELEMETQAGSIINNMPDPGDVDGVPGA